MQVSYNPCSSRGFAQKVFFAEDISRAKAQRRKALPRFRRFSLRLCAFAREIFLPPMRPASFCAKPQAAALQGGAQFKLRQNSGRLRGLPAGFIKFEGDEH